MDHALILSLLIKCKKCNNPIEIITEDLYEISGIFIKNDIIEIITRFRNDLVCDRCKSKIIEKDKNVKIIIENNNPEKYKIEYL